MSEERPQEHAPGEPAPGEQGWGAIDTTVPQSARIWNYWLGGTDNYPVDRAAGDAYLAVFPGITDIARASRGFLARSIRFLAGEAGVRQFLDIGTGLPTGDSTHEVAQRVAPESHVVYIDNDPLVLGHANALLTSTREGSARFIQTDLREPETVLDAAAQTLDLERPAALILSGILGHVGDYEDARSIVGRLLERLPSGSYLSLNEGADTDPAYAAAQQSYNESGAVPYYLRSPEQIAGYFEGLQLVDPGVVSVPQWRPDGAPDTGAPDAGVPQNLGQYGGVGRKP